MICTVCHFTLIKNWLKHVFDLTAYVWEAAPCSTLPTADENAVTESAVTTVSSSLFQSATVLTKNEFLYCSVLLSGISCLAMVLSEWQDGMANLMTRIWRITRWYGKSDEQNLANLMTRGRRRRGIKQVVAMHARTLAAFTHARAGTRARTHTHTHTRMQQLAEAPPPPQPLATSLKWKSRIYCTKTMLHVQAVVWKTAQTTA